MPSDRWTRSSTTQRSRSSGRSWTSRSLGGVASWRVTVHAPLLLSKLVLPDMLARGGGRIINVTSESAVGPGAGPPSTGTPVGDAAYGAQKAAIERLTQGLGQEVH